MSRKAPEASPAMPVRFPLGEPSDAPPADRRGLIALLSVLLLCATLLDLPLWQRALLAAVAVAGLVRVALAARSRTPRLGEVLVDTHRIQRVGRRGAVTLAAFDAPFGLSILADPRRTRAILAFTTPTEARYLTVRLAAPTEGSPDRSLLARSAAVAESDALAAQLDDATLAADAALELVTAVEHRCPEAMGRIYVSGANGEPVVLDRQALRVGNKTFDLAAALEWKAFMFHESVGTMAMLYHATWVRQSDAEVVLISPMPPEVSSLFAEGPDGVRAIVERSSELQRVVTKDLRVMQAAAEPPPPVETRVAVERLFMFPLRRALDTAPRARVSVPPFRHSSPPAAPAPRSAR